MNDVGTAISASFVLGLGDNFYSYGEELIFNRSML
jgi:hypothetical protein